LWNNLKKRCAVAVDSTKLDASEGCNSEPNTPHCLARSDHDATTAITQSSAFTVHHRKDDHLEARYGEHQSITSQIFLLRLLARAHSSYSRAIFVMLHVATNTDRPPDI